MRALTPGLTTGNAVELPENFDSNEASKRGRVDGDEGMCLRGCYGLHSGLRPFHGGWRPNHAQQRGEDAPQA